MLYGLSDLIEVLYILQDDYGPNIHLKLLIGECILRRYILIQVIL